MASNDAVFAEMKEKAVRVLDHGSIALLDKMGSDEEIAQAARVSYQKGTKQVSDNRGLLRRLLRDRHTTPFEMAELKFYVKLPIFVERQWIRHRMASTNEVSARYSELPEEYYIPEAESVCSQSKTNKQGRDSRIDATAAAVYRQSTNDVSHRAFEVYQSSLRNDVSREIARIPLPLGTYTEKFWKIDLHNLIHFLGLRMDAHAQWEVRQYANVMGDMVAKLFPITWQAFLDFRMNAMQLSALDIKQINALPFSYGKLPQVEFGKWVIQEWLGDAKCSERDEFIVKAIRLGMIEPFHALPSHSAR
jgi:thymidylate synthase (FAD)